MENSGSKREVIIVSQQGEKVSSRVLVKSKRQTERNNKRVGVHLNLQ